MRKLPARVKMGGVVKAFVVAIIAASLFRASAPGFVAPMQPAPGPCSPQGETRNIPAESLAASLEQALAKGQTETARDLLTQILTSPQLDADLLLRVGVRLAEHDLYAEAAQAFARCAREHPEIFEGHYNLALAEFALQKFPDALRALEAAPHGSKAEELARLYLRGKIQEALGHPAEAERDLSGAFAGAPEQENFALDLGLFYLRRNAYPRAAEVFERGAAHHPGSAFLLLGLSLAQFLAGRAAESVEASRELIRLEPNFSPARVLLAFALYIGGNLEEAEKVTASGLAAERPEPYLYYLHAVVLLKLQSKDYDRMLAELDVAKRAIPACTLCLLAAGKVRQAKGDVPQAVAELEEATRLDAGFAEAWYRLGGLYERAGRAADAQRARRKFAALKEEKTSREGEMIRNVVLETLSGSEAATRK